VDSEFWQEHIKQQKKGSQNVVAYCRDRGLDTQAFYYQRRKSKQKLKSQEGKLEVSRSELVKVELPKPPTATTGSIEVQIGDKIKIVGSEWPPAEVLKAYQKVLVG